MHLLVTSAELSGSVDTTTCNHFMSAKVFLYREQFGVYETHAQIALCNHGEFLCSVIP